MIFKYFSIIEILSVLILLIILNFLIINYWHKIKQKLKIKNYNKKQKVHLEDTPRLAGAVIFIIYLIFISLNLSESKTLLYLFLSFLPLFFISIKEDLYQNTSISKRIFAMVFCCIIFFNLNKTSFPLIDIPLFYSLFSNNLFLFIFFTFSSLVLINGFNLIDGMNGILGFTAITQLISLCYISYLISDYEIFNYSILFILPIIIFLFFNFPLGKIFIGDTGAYFCGFVVSILTIEFFGRYENILSWNAVLLLFYPSFELLFSFIRKIFFEKKKPFKADDLHLHSIIFKFGVSKNINPRVMNNLVLFILSPFWLSPLLVIFLYNNLQFIIFSLILLILLYISCYLFFRFNLKSEKKINQLL